MTIFHVEELIVGNVNLFHTLDGFSFDNWYRETNTTLLNEIGDRRN